MKTDRWPRSVGMLMILAGLLTFPGCNNDDDSVPLNQAQLTKLSKDWKVQSVSLDGVDNTSYYPGFSLTISGTDPTSFVYTTSGRPHYSPWPASGDLVFGTDVRTTLVRDSGSGEAVNVSYAVTASTLELTFTFSDDPYNARTSAVQGQWRFVFGL